MSRFVTKNIEIDDCHNFKITFNGFFVLKYVNLSIFGMIDRSTKQFHCKIGLKHYADTLFNILFSHTTPGNIINSEG